MQESEKERNFTLQKHLLKLICIQSDVFADLSGTARGFNFAVFEMSSGWLATDRNLLISIIFWIFMPLLVFSLFLRRRRLAPTSDYEKFLSKKKKPKTVFSSFAVWNCGKRPCALFFHRRRQRKASKFSQHRFYFERKRRKCNFLCFIFRRKCVVLSL